jgi:hypothetical protein
MRDRPGAVPRSHRGDHAFVLAKLGRDVVRADDVEALRRERSRYCAFVRRLEVGV